MKWNNTYLLSCGSFLTWIHADVAQSCHGAQIPWMHDCWHSYTVSHLMFVDTCFIAQFTKKNPTICNNVSKFYYSIFIWSSTCFGRHTAHHQEPKTALAATGFLYVAGCWTCSWWTLSGTVCLTTSGTLCLTRGCQCSFRLLMMGGASPETCWASYKYGILKVWYIVASCWIFLCELTHSFCYLYYNIFLGVTVPSGPGPPHSRGF